MRMTEQEYLARTRRTRTTDKGFVIVDGGKGRFQRDTKAKARPPRPRHECGNMNTGEKAYAMHLDQLLDAGEIAGWWYELMTFKLAERCSIQPDFTVMLPDGSIELHEIKGGKTVQQAHGPEWTYWAEEDARVKLRIAAKLIPFPLIVVWPAKGGFKFGWKREVMKGE